MFKSIKKMKTRIPVHFPDTHISWQDKVPKFYPSKTIFPTPPFLEWTTPDTLN